MIETNEGNQNILNVKIANFPVEVKVVNKGIEQLPAYAHQGDSGMDLRADFTHGNNEQFFYRSAWDEERAKLLIFPGGRALIPTGLHVAIPEGYELQIRPKSGLALKYGITVLNTPGTVDSPYRGEIGVILLNTSDSVFEVEQGMKVAQAVLTEVKFANWKQVESLEDTDRNEGGFGSTGLK